MGYKITALETQVDAMAAQLKYEMERQNRLITELMVGLNHFIDLCHKGRFAGSGDGPRLALVKAETTNNRHSLAGQGSYTPLTPARPPLYDRTPNGDEIWKI